MPRGTPRGQRFSKSSNGRKRAAAPESVVSSIAVEHGRLLAFEWEGVRSGEVSMNGVVPRLLGAPPAPGESKSVSSVKAPPESPARTVVRGSSLGDVLVEPLINSGSITSIDPEQELWGRVVAQAKSPDRARDALTLLAGNVDNLDPRLVQHAAAVVWAAGTTRDGADTEGLVTPVQGMRALQK